MNQTEKEDALKRCGVLATADDSALKWLAETAQTYFFEADEVVFEEGDSSSHVYVVAAGSLQIRQGQAAKLVSFAESGALFGEYAMFVKSVRIARVTAAEPSVLLAFDEDRFREFLLRCPAVMMELFQTAVRRLHRIERKRS